MRLPRLITTLVERRVRFRSFGGSFTVKWLGISVFVLFVGATAAMFHRSNQPVFCRSCHEMDVHYRTWAESSHKDVNCEECHIMPGLTNMVKTKVNALGMVKKHVRRAATSMPA